MNPDVEQGAAGCRVPGCARPVARRAILVLALGGLLSGCARGGDGSQAGTAPSGSATAAAAGAPRQSDALVAPAQWRAARESAARDRLHAQATAVIAGDVEAALSAVSAGAERSAQRRRLQQMQQVGLESLSLVGLTEVTPPAATASGQTVPWEVDASFDYRIRGFDTVPRRFVLKLTLSGSPSRPEEVVITASRPADRPQPWDLGDLEVRRSRHALVLVAGSSIDIDEALRRADRAASEVAAVWGTARPAVWMAPSSATDAERLLGRSAGALTGLAAATDGPLDPGAPAGADRIVLNPAAWAVLRAQGRDVVMTHELTHVTVRASTTRAVPLWLSEGFAEYVAYRSLDVPERTVVGAYAPTLRAQGVPRHLPGPAEFEPGAGSVPAAYAQAWEAVLALVESHGEEGVVRFYRAAAGGLAVTPTVLADPEAIVDAALRETLHTSREGVEAAWRERLGALTR